jgi:hypothetical protein
MDKETFRQNLEKATSFVLPFTRGMLTNSLPLDYLYLLFPNQSYDKNPLVIDEEVYPQESLPDRRHLSPMEADGVVHYLWRDGKVPEWINISVHSYDENYTYLEMICCGRFSASDELLYHKQEGYPPFHVLSPSIPPGWESVEKSGKFDLHWRSRKPK